MPARVGSYAERVERLLLETILEINGQIPESERITPDLDAALTGPKGRFDSLTFINFVVSAEERIQQEFDQGVSLSELTMSPDADETFISLRSLAGRLTRLLSEP